MSNEHKNDLQFQLDERNLAHFLTAITLCGIASEITGNDATCWWGDTEFVLRTDLSYGALINSADCFIRKIRWIHGIGDAEQGTFKAGARIGSNPFISLVDGGQKKSPFKTFSGQINPGSLLDNQQSSLELPNDSASEVWLSQISRNISSWGFDCRVGYHAYDYGFSSNDEGSGSLDPVFTAVELLSIAATAFFIVPQTWQDDEVMIHFSAWTHPISVALVSYASGGLLSGLPARRYRAANRGAAYGKGAAYRFFPEAAIEV